MKRIVPMLAAALVLLACADTNDPAQLESVSAAFQTVPVGFDNAQHSFVGSLSGDNEWAPDGRGGSGGDDREMRSGDGRHQGPGGGDGHHRGGGFDKGPGFGLLMGGGLHGLFLGDGFALGFGRGLGEPALIGICTFDAASGRISCDPVTRGGLTITRSAAYKDAGGNAQTAFNETTTNSINVRVAVTGTIPRRRHKGTSEVDAASDRTVSGLLASSTERTINGTSRASENISGTDSTGAYTAERIAGDTTANVVIPKSGTTDAKPFPISGSVTRSMQVTLTREGEAPIVSSRREVITYDGTNTAKIVITENGTTKNCTLPLPRGRISCP